MIVTRGVVLPLALLIALTTVTVGYYAGIGDAPRAFFGDAGTLVIGPPSGQIPGEGEVPAALAGALQHLPHVRHVSPEIYVLTTLEGRSVFVRGVVATEFLAIEGARLGAGALPASGEAIVGDRLARALGLEVGDRFLVPATFSRVGVPLKVAGILEDEGTAADEVVVPLAEARALTDLAESSVHVIRVDTSARDELSALISTVAPTFTYSDVRVSSNSALPGEPLTVRANLTNWGLLRGPKLVQVMQGEHALAERVYVVSSRETLPVELEFVMREDGPRNVTINPTFTIEAREPSVRFENVPGETTLGRPFTFRLVDLAGEPVAGVQVRARDIVVETDAAGTATLTPTGVGRTFLRADRNGVAEGIAETTVLDVGAEGSSQLVVREIRQMEEVLGTLAPTEFRVYVENRGGMEGSTPVRLLLNGQAVGAQTATVAPGRVAELAFRIGPLTPGSHRLRVEDWPVELHVTAYPGRDPRVEALLASYETRGPEQDSVAIPRDAQDYVSELVGNISLAILALSLASGGLAATGAASVLSRHLAERAPAVGVIKALGATDEHVGDLAARQAAGWATLASVLGIAGGIALAEAIDATGVVRAFGHTVHPSFTWHAVGVLFVLSVGFVVLVSRGFVRTILKRPIDELLRGQLLRPGLQEPPALSAVLEARR